MEAGQLASSYAFENEEFIFPGIANVVRFTLLTLREVRRPPVPSEFAFYLRRVEQISERERVFLSTFDDFDLLNPNTRTCPLLGLTLMLR